MRFFTIKNKHKNDESISALSLKKKIIFSIITLFLLFFVVEILLRVIFSFYVGPSVLLYGTNMDRNIITENSKSPRESPKIKGEAKIYLESMTQDEWNKRRDVEIHPNKLNGYSKYFANQKRIDFDVETGDRFEVKINSLGFRGQDFSVQKDPGVIRIICLGASSTFGYFDRDDETYPVYLEQLINQRYQGKLKVEVINLGIPHLSSDEIYNLFLAEGVKLQPDIVTFYEGNNDSDPPQRWMSKRLAHVIINKIGHVSLFAKFIDSIYSKYRFGSLYQSLSDKDVVDNSNNFIANVSAINQECSKRGILFIVANQQKQSQLFDRAMLKELTYQQEEEKVKDKLQRLGALNHPEFAFLIHSILMEKLGIWAAENKIPFVDVIGALDHDRDVLVSWVHLSPKGNRMVAEALANKIDKYIVTLPVKQP